MTVFVDTSAIFALLDHDDAHNHQAAHELENLIESDALATTNYVIVEATALAQRRLGAAAAKALSVDLAPLLEVVWIDEEIHAAATAALLASRGRRVSLVDFTSFEVMRRRGIRSAFAFDRDFDRQGFDTVP